MRSLRSFALALCLAATPALAHDPTTLDRMPSPHGGQVRMAGPYHLELVLEAERVTLHVMDHANQPLPVEGGRATATIGTGDAARTVELLPTGSSTLGRDEDLRLGPGTRVEVTISLPGGQEWSATFTPKGAADPAG